MQRRTIMIIAVIFPIMIVALLKLVYPLSYNFLIAYIATIVVIFKSSILSIWFASKLKLLAFVKTLTLFKGISLTIKRWIIDNLLSKWLKKHLFSPLKEASKELKSYLLAMSFKAKMKNALLLFLPVSIVSWMMYASNMLASVGLYAELKLLVSGFFKLIWLFLAKALTMLSLMLAWISSSWLAPIIELFALSFLLDKAEKRLGKGNPITGFFTTISNFFNALFEKIGLYHDRHISPFVLNHSQNLGRSISAYVKKKKIAQEFLYFDNFQNIILQGHINAYHHFKDMDKITDKKAIYQRINQNTNDNIDIIAYISRDAKGNLVDESVPNDFYHDIFLLKGIASHHHHGVKEPNETGIDHTDFWVLNTSKYPATLKSNSNNFPDTTLAPHSVSFIKTAMLKKCEEDVVVAFKGTQRESPTSIS